MRKQGPTIRTLLPEPMRASLSGNAHLSPLQPAGMKVNGLGAQPDNPDGRELAMNITRLRRTALVLQHKLDQYSKIDPEAAALNSDLKPLLELAKAGNLSEPIQVGAVPGHYRFTEKNLQQYGELEDAYADFSMEVTGGEPTSLKLWIESRNKTQNSE
jgi:hypothetical protein